MLILILGLVLFLGIHSIRLFANDWRTTQIERMGLWSWKRMFALVSIIGFVLIVWGFKLAQPTSLLLWTSPTWMPHLTAVLMLLAFIFLVAAYIPGNHLKARFGHPMVLATKSWAVAHLLVNVRLVNVVLFGAFLVWSVVYFMVMRRRDRLAGVSYPAIGVGRDLLVAIVGIIAFVLFACYGHEWLFGVRPFH